MSTPNAPQKVRVKVPATTANLGPGFDCLGMALDLWNVVQLERGPLSVTVTGEGAERLSRNESNLVYRAAARVFLHLGLGVPSLTLTCQNAIPLARGLGSSAAAAVGGLLAANALCGNPLSQRDLLKLAVDLEGHPDNVVPALLGGCQIAAQDGEGLLTSRVALPPELGVVLFVPTTPMPTAQARAILSNTVSRADAVFNVGRAALLVNALATGQLELLGKATEDRLHQPQRETLFPPMRLLFRAALKGGALGVCLSGAGSSVLAFTRGKEMTVAYELADEARRAGVEGTLLVTRPTEEGATTVSIE